MCKVNLAKKGTRVLPSLVSYKRPILMVVDSTLLDDLPPQGSRQQSFKASLWPRFHLFRVKHVPKIWHETVGAVDPILMQRGQP